MTKDILGRRFNFPDEKEQDFLIAIDPPVDLGHRVNWLKREGIPSFSPGQEEICLGELKSPNPIEGRNLALLVLIPSTGPTLVPLGTEQMNI